jgi:phage shock protein PspC (stress-responsive transcriptional regulator)
MSEHIAEPVVTKRLERSRDDRWLAGVCGGLARYFGIHPAFYRVGFVVLTLLGGSGILVYLAAYLVIPAEGEQESIAAEALRNRGRRPWPLVALSILAVAGIVLLSRATVHAPGDAFWVLLFVAGLLILRATRRSARTATDASPQALAAEDSRRVRRTGRIVGIVVTVLLVLVLATAGVLAAIFNVNLGHGVGNRTYEVASASELHSKYELGIGDLKLDLTDLQLPAGTTHVATRVDVGNLDVIVPQGVALEVNADAQAGVVDLFGTQTDGRDVNKSLTQQGARVLVLDAHVGAGNLKVERAVR